jgi:hypothetical protein
VFRIATTSSAAADVYLLVLGLGLLGREVMQVPVPAVRR